MPQEFLPNETSIKPSIDAESMTESDLVVHETDNHDTAAVDAILAEVRGKIKQRMRRFAINCNVVPIVTVVLATIPIVLLKPTMDTIIWPYCIYVCFLLGVACRLIFGDSMQTFPFNTEELTRMGGVKAIGTLMDACSMNIKYAQKRALYTAVIPLLHQLKASDSNLLTHAHRHHLHMWLAPEDFGVRITAGRFRLKLASLKALEQVGDKDSIPVVQRLADMKPRTDRWRQIKEAALECLPYLEARLGIDSAKTTLLRGSCPETSPPDTLLRPAVDSPSTHTDHLLRPSDEIHQP